MSKSADQPKESSGKSFADQESAVVFTAQDEVEANMVQELLLNAGIESMINARISPSVYPFNLGPLAKRDIVVLESDVPQASRIIAEQESAPELPDAGPPEEEA